MQIIIIDNYDSFTFNLYQVVGEILQDHGEEIKIDVIRNDVTTLAEIKNKNYVRIIISPGPGDPSDQKYFGVCADVIRGLGPTIPLLGVCLGMQGTAYCFGGKIIRATQPMHGKTSIITHDSQGIFRNVPQNVEVMRYHSLVVDKESLPADFVITATATSTNGQEEIMGLRHKKFPIEGVQFHPESFATEAGKTMLGNFIFQTTNKPLNQ